MVLGVDVEPLRRVAAERAGEVLDPAEARVVPVALTRQKRVQSMVEMVVPDRVARGRPMPPRVVQPDLADHDRAAVDSVHAPGELGHDVLVARVEDRVDRVQSQTVDPEIANPLHGALADPLADRLARVVNRPAPGRLVLVGEVRPERLQCLYARRADVVVDDVEDDREPGFVRRVEEPRQPGRAAIGRLRRRQVNAVISPSSLARKLRNRHQLDRGHAELRELAEVGDHALECALRRERPHVELVDHEILERGR